MRADVTIMLLDAKANLLRRLAQARADAPGAPTPFGDDATVPASNAGSTRSIRVTSMEQLYALLEREGGPRGI